MFCQARARRNSLITWQRSARPSAVHPTSVRWWKKTATAWKKAPRGRQGTSGSGGDQDPVRAEAEQQAEQERPGDERRHREAPADVEQLDDHVQDRATCDGQERPL